MSLKRKTPLHRSLLKPSARNEFGKTLKPWKGLKSKQRPVSADDRILWERMAGEIGCIACKLDGNINPFVSIHHIDGRTKPGCHKLVLSLCAGHHQDGTGNDKTMIAVHPYKKRFEQRYGSQMALLAMCMELLGAAGC